MRRARDQHVRGTGGFFKAIPTVLGGVRVPGGVSGPRDHHVRGTGGFASKVINIPIQILSQDTQHGGHKDR